MHNLLGLDNQRFTQLYGSGTQTLPGGQKECLTKGKLGIGKGGHWERWMDGWMRNRKGKYGQWESLNVHVSSLQPCGKQIEHVHVECNSLPPSLICFKLYCNKFWTEFLI